MISLVLKIIVYACLYGSLRTISGMRWRLKSFQQSLGANHEQCLDRFANLTYVPCPGTAAEEPYIAFPTHT